MSVHPRSLVRWAFLSVVFITFSLAAVWSEEGKYLVCFLNTYPEGDIYYVVGSDLPAVHLKPFFGGEYACAYVSEMYISPNAEFRVAVRGSSPLGKTVVLPAIADLVHEGNDLYVVRTTYVDKERNTAYVVYSAEGAGYVLIQEDIPKSVASGPEQIIGDVIFEETDPVVLVHLRVEKGRPSFARFLITSYDSNVPPVFSRDVQFSACSLRVASLSLERIEISGKEMLSGRFQILDGDRPVYLTQISVSVGKETVTPQFSSTEKTYSFLIPIGNAEKVEISADAPGCSHLVHEVPVPLRKGNLGSYLFYALILLVLVGAFVYYFRRR